MHLKHGIYSKLTVKFIESAVSGNAFFRNFAMLSEKQAYFSDHLWTAVYSTIY